MSSKKNTFRHDAFTLIELITVIVIMAVVALVVAARRPCRTSPQCGPVPRRRALLRMCGTFKERPWPPACEPGSLWMQARSDIRFTLRTRQAPARQAVSALLIRWT
ncbi:MAG: prepilin-type N-terminal cleavage/methylation domain-containing protein [Planctomycetes bacterium]|nr:prepilin-type N-terminal cleavage/methylation domain-containing protein [Planctomycetota bacterium]